MRRFVVIGRTATASADFVLDDVPGSAGRLDVLLRCVRASLLVSHGVRKDGAVYLVLGGGPRAPRSVRIDGATVSFLRQDERSLAGLMKSMLAWVDEKDVFDAGLRGVSIARGGLDVVLDDLGVFTPYVLDESGEDVRAAQLDVENPVFFVGDHLGFDDATRAKLDEIKAKRISVGPISLHADDAIVVVTNELDRRKVTP